MTRATRLTFLTASLLLSLGGAGFGFWRAWAFEKTPGMPAITPSRWPAGVTLQRSATLPTLVMVVHPECPCSRASLGELAQLMSHCPGKLAAYVLFVRSPDSPGDPTAGQLWNESALTGVTRVDDAGNLAHSAFGARTSGQIFFYDIQGRLLFKGGITDSRGHAGDNAGRSAIEGYLLTGTMAAASTPVFGCALQ